MNLKYIVTNNGYKDIKVVNLSRNIGTRKPLQVAEVILHVVISGCNLQWLQNKYCMQSLQKVEPSSTLCNRYKPKKFWETSCEEECHTLLTYLQLASQTHCNTNCKDGITLPVEIGSTFGNDYRDFLKPLQPEIATYNKHVYWNLQFTTLQYRLQRKSRRVTLAIM